MRKILSNAFVYCTRLHFTLRLRWLLLMLPATVHAQDGRVNQYHFETGALVATDQTPFWLRANQYGIIPLKGPVLRLQGGIRSDYRLADTTGRRPKVDWGYAVDAVANVGVTNQVLFPEAHVKGRLGAFELYVGRKRELIGLADTLLTSGSYIWSGNALPIPKIQIGLYQYTPVPFTKGIISFLGAFAHGWFENGDRLVKGSYLHQKYLYGRLGKPTWPFRLYGGFNHEVVWAGQAAPGVLSPVVAVNGQLPSAIRYYPAVVFGTRNAFDPAPTLTSFDQNRVGNHLGSLDFGADATVSHWNLFAYRQFFYDDGSLFYGTNLADGLNGLRLKNLNQPAGQLLFLRQLSLEFLSTVSQGGNQFSFDDGEQRGMDDYFNNGQFIDGWTYYKRTIGNPFLTPSIETRPSLPQRIGIGNNRVSAGILGVSMLVANKLTVLSRFSLSKNLGSYAVPYPDAPTQFSGLLSASLPVPAFGGSVVSGSLGVDLGGLLPTSVGMYVAVRKTGLLSRNNTPGAMQP